MTAELVPVTKTVVDTADRLEHYLRTASAAGRLITPPEDIDPVALKSGHYAIRVTVREPAPRLTWRQRSAAFDRRHPILGPCLKALTFGGTLALLVVGSIVGIVLIGYHAIGAAVLGKAVLVIIGSAAAALILTVLSSRGNHKGMGWHYTKCK